MRHTVSLLLILFCLNSRAQFLENDLPLVSYNFYMDNPAAVSEDHQISSSFAFNSNFYSESVNGSFLHSSNVWLDDKYNVGIIGFYKNDFFQQQMRVALSFTRIFLLDDVQLKVGVRPSYIKRDFKDYTSSAGRNQYYDKLNLGFGSVIRYNRMEIGASVGPYTSLTNVIPLSQNFVGHTSSLNFFGKYKFQLHPKLSITPFGNFVTPLNLENITIRNYHLGTEFSLKRRIHFWLSYNLIAYGNDHFSSISDKLYGGIRAEIFKSIIVQYQYSMITASLSAYYPHMNHLFGLSFKMSKE